MKYLFIFLVIVALGMLVFVYTTNAPSQLETIETPPSGELPPPPPGELPPVPPIYVEDFEGEADPDRMTLDMTEWRWVETYYNNDTKVVPKEFGVFTLTFAKDGGLSVGTDCNVMNGSYEVEGNRITIGPLMSTRMYCEGSQETEFSKMLSEVQSYLFTSKGELVLELPYDTGAMIFR